MGELQKYFAYICRLYLNLFESSDITEKLESLTNENLACDFIASFCNSIDGGAEAIDISESQDIFGIGKDYEWAKKFISHVSESFTWVFIRLS